MSEKVTISGNRHQVSEEAWAGWLGDTTAAEFMDGRDDIEAAVNEFVQAVPDMFGEPAPVFFWREMNADYTLAELLTRYLEDNL